MIFCIVLFFGIYLFDGIGLLQRIYVALRPFKLSWETAPSENIDDIRSPILEPIAEEEIVAHEAEKLKAEEEHEQDIINSEVFEEKILENIKEQERSDSEESDKVANITGDAETNIISDPLPSWEIDNRIEQPSLWESPEETNIDIPEDTHNIPITASIPETRIEQKESMESQYTEKLYTISCEVKTLLARWQTQEARALIIQWLAINKNHRELNLMLGSIYEWERQAQKAEYIYKDLALVYENDGEILERLANILIVQKRYDLALEIYKKITSISGETEWSLYIMTHLAHELWNNDELYIYSRKYQKNWPNNPDILALLAQAEIAIGHRQDAIQTLIKLKNLTPYNNEIMETIAKLTMEEELAGNFSSRDNS